MNDTVKIRSFRFVCISVARRGHCTHSIKKWGDGHGESLVCISVARRGHRTHSFQRSYGDLGRDRVRERAMQDALAALHEAVQL